MIAAVKWWYAASAALWLLPPPPATAADDLPGAARELARKTAMFVGRGEPVVVTWRNSSSLTSAELAQARQVFEAALQAARGGAGDSPALQAATTEARITLSENLSQYLLVEEVRRAEERQVWIARWTRQQSTAAPIAGATLEKQLLWEQDEPILDVAVAGDTMLVLAPGKLTWFQRQNGHWSPATSIGTELKALPRDPRGRLRASGAAFEAYLPGIMCKVTPAPPALDCKEADDAWVLESGARFLLVANFVAARNYFDGRIATQSGVRKTVAPFYSAAGVEEAGKTLWLLATVDGRTQIFDGGWEPAETIDAWGSDIAGIDARCRGGSAVLATRSGDGHEPDAIQAFAIVNRRAVPLTPAIDFSGPVTALWTSSGSSAVAVVRDLGTGRYAAYRVTLACGS